MKFSKWWLRLRSSTVVVAAVAAALGAAAPGWSAPAAKEPATPSPTADLRMLDAITWGASPSSFERMRAMGRAAWLRDQLRPDARTALAPAVQAEIDKLTQQGSLGDRMGAFAAQAKAANALADPAQRDEARKAYQTALNEASRAAAGAMVLRALYDPAQLRERMTWFWFNRFNVFSGKGDARGTVGDYVDRAIRPNALGRFRDLLGATLRHPAMLRYLDNADNAVGHINENYARELLERHTMGAGSGYTQADVEQLARILTGVGISLRPEPPAVKPAVREDVVRDGMFEFNPARHDYGVRTLLGQMIDARGFAQVEQALDVLCRQPATARSVARAMAVYFVADTPPDALVDRLASTYLRHDGDIAAMLEVLFGAPEFTAVAGTRFKDPVRFVFSALRLAYDTRVVLNTSTVQSWLNRMGEGLFIRTTPDGYPLASTAWTGPGQLAVRFEIARQIGSGPGSLFKASPDSEPEPAFPLLQNRLYFAVLEPTLGAQTRGVLAQAVSPQDWNMLFLASPEFMQ